MNPPKVSIFQIFYDCRSRESLDPEAIPLDNRVGPPDWYEFWPILNFLRTNELEEDRFYAFLSPSFRAKTGFSLSDVKSIAAQERQRDVIVFSSYWLGVFLTRNPWVRGDELHPGLLSRAQDFFDAIGADTNLSRLTTDSTTTAFSNYLVAKPTYWRKWQEIAEQYHAYVEAQGPEGSHQQVTDYRGERAVAFKVFIQERLCSHVLLSNDFDTVMPDHPFMGKPPAHPERFRTLLAQIDHLKRRHRATGNPLYLLRVRLLGIACSRTSRGGTFPAWLLGAFRRKFGRIIPLSKQ